MESKGCNSNNNCAASTKCKMTLHPQEVKGFSFEKCLSDDDQFRKGSKTNKDTKSRISTSSSKSSKSKHSFKSSSSTATSSIGSLKMKKTQLEK